MKVYQVIITTLSLNKFLLDKSVYLSKIEFNNYLTLYQIIYSTGDKII